MDRRTSRLLMTVALVAIIVLAAVVTLTGNR
jgi:hypothetical protein